MIGIALAGGGAKGAYQAGAYIALRKNHIKPKIIAGTSIGSINAALMAQGDIKKLKQLWLNTTSDIFGIDSTILEKIKNKEITTKDIKPAYKSFQKILKNKGIDTTEYYNIIKSALNEKKLRKSKIKFGLVTVKLDGLPKPVELLIDDIPNGKVSEYILASCYLPVFKMKPIIDDNYYIDGGFYNNIPLDLVEKYGCDTIYAIKIKGIGFSRNKLKKETKVITIEPHESLGSTLIFDQKSNEKNMSLGYYDTIKVLKNLDGYYYYFKHMKIDNYQNLLENIDAKLINKLYRKYKTKSSKELIINITEKILKENNVKRFQILNIKKELRLIRKKYIIKDKDTDLFIKQLKIPRFIL